MQAIKKIRDLEELYDAVVPAALTKVLPRLSPLYQQWIEASRFLVLSTVGPDGTDASPRGDDRAVVRVADSKTLWLPDWRGNNRIDSLRNIVRDGRVSLMFMVPGCNNVVRVNGTAILTADEKATAQFEKNGKHPMTMIVITVGEVYFQCAKALMRSGLWQSGGESDRVPSAGRFIKEIQAGFDAEEYDAGYADYARDRMW
jgi:hypothetical protein